MFGISLLRGPDASGGISRRSIAGLASPSFRWAPCRRRPADGAGDCGGVGCRPGRPHELVGEAAHELVGEAAHELVGEAARELVGDKNGADLGDTFGEAKEVKEAKDEAFESTLPLP